MGDGARNDVWGCVRRDGRTLFAQRPPEKVLGRMGEENAAESLERRGYDILERNWVCKAGEADIIARDEEGTVALVEVKTRYTPYGREGVMPELAVDEKKTDIYRRIAQFYISIHSELPAIRFDIVAVNLSGPRSGHIHHVCNAYSWDD